MSKEKDYDKFTGIFMGILIYACGFYLGASIEERSVKKLCEESGYFTNKNDIYACHKEDMSVHKIGEKQ